MYNKQTRKFNKQNNNTNLMICDDLGYLITFVKKQEDLTDVNNFFDKLDITGVELQKKSMHVSGEFKQTVKESSNNESSKDESSSSSEILENLENSVSASAIQLSGELKSVQELANDARIKQPSKPNQFFTANEQINARMESTRKANEELLRGIQSRIESVNK